MTDPYPIKLTPDPDSGYVAEHPDLPGCVSQGETPDEAVEALEEARHLWIKVRLEDGLPIPGVVTTKEHADLTGASDELFLRRMRTAKNTYTKIVQTLESYIKDEPSRGKSREWREMVFIRCMRGAKQAETILLGAEDSEINSTKPRPST